MDVDPIAWTCATARRWEKGSGMVKYDALCGELVEVRRAHKRVAVAPIDIGAVLI